MIISFSVGLRNNPLSFNKKFKNILFISVVLNPLRSYLFPLQSTTKVVFYYFLLVGTFALNINM